MLEIVVSWVGQDRMIPTESETEVALSEPRSQDRPRAARHTPVTNRRRPPTSGFRSTRRQTRTGGWTVEGVTSTVRRPFLSRGTRREKRSVTASSALRRLPNSPSVPARGAHAHVSPCGRPWPSGVTRPAEDRNTLSVSSSAFSCRPPPRPAPGQHVPGRGPAPDTEAHDSSVFCMSQMTSVQHSRLPLL